MPKVRVKEDTLWYDRLYRAGEEANLEGEVYLDLLRAGRLDAPVREGSVRSPSLDACDIEGRHEGELVFVLGNGPSIKLAQGFERKLKALTTIGVNRIYRFIKTDYLLFLDGPFWVADGEQIVASGSSVFCPKRLHLPYFTPFGRYRAKDRQDVLSERWDDGLYWSRSSSVAALNLAFLFGAAQIALLGVDLFDYSHFYCEDGRNRRFPHADKILEDLWRMSQKMLEKGLQLWNCSPESAVRGFEKIELSELLAIESEKKTRR